jgi:hypothetical protein
MTVESVTGYLGEKATRRWETLSRFTGGLLHTLSFGHKRPIEIQRALKLRDFQNGGSFPRPMASALSALIGAGLDGTDDAERPSCLLVVGERNCAS